MNEDPMVIASLIGGLGNQMFQYAAARALADRHNAPLLLDTSGFEDYPLRRFELGELKIRAEIATPHHLDTIRPQQFKNKLGRILSHLESSLRRPGKIRIFNERSFAYDANFFEQSPPIYLNGYWQSERYFLDSARAIREDFTLKLPLDSACQNVLGNIKQTTSVSLHVRRGDYVTNTTTAQFHGTCSLAYYQAAVGYIAAQVTDPHFFVFSDDLDWVGKNLHVPYLTTLVDVNGPDRGVADMALMSACQHHIIANSSFSWWGAWLNSAENKIVVAPQRWFNQASHDTRDLLPESWVKL